MVNCVKLMLRTFEFAVSQFDCFVYHLNIACLKRFARYGHYTGQVEAQSQSSLQSLCQKLERLVAIDDAMLKRSWLCFCGHTVYRYTTIHLMVPVVIKIYITYYTHTQLYSPFEKAAQLYAKKNESEHLTNQQHKTLKKNAT